MKGLSGKGQQIELSPNEYTALTALATDYRLAIVSDALSTPQLRIARYSGESKVWVVEGDQDAAVSIQPKNGAVVRFAKQDG